MLIYDFANPATKERIGSYWLPKIQSINEQVPILLVGNKSDIPLQPEAQHQELNEFIDKLVHEFPQIELGIECSAKKFATELTDLIYCAQRAVIYPIFPLFDQKTKVCIQLLSNRA